MSDRIEAFSPLMDQVWDAYWQEEPAGTRAALERVVSTVLNHVDKKITDLASDAPDGGYDNGATRDGWEMALKTVSSLLADNARGPR